MNYHTQGRGAAVSRRLSYGVSDTKLEVLRRLRVINDAHCHNGDVGRVLERFNVLMDEVESTCQMANESGMIVADEKERSNLGEAHALVITAPSFAGKSHILEQIAKDHRIRPFEDEEGVHRVFLPVDAPFPCTIKTLALEFLSALNVPYAKTSNVHLLWHMVRRQLIAQGVLIIQINEFHNTLIDRNRKELETLATACKAMLVGTTIIEAPDTASDAVRNLISDHGERYPVFLILAGTPMVHEFTRDVSTEHHEQFSRRCKEVEFQEIKVTRKTEDTRETKLTGKDESGTPEYVGMGKLIKSIQIKMEFAPDDRLTTPDMQARFYKASGKHYGRMLHVIKLAARLTVRSGGTSSIYDNLPDAFEALYKTGSAANCFLVPDIDRCPYPPTVVHVSTGTRRPNYGRTAE